MRESAAVDVAPLNPNTFAGWGAQAPGAGPHRGSHNFTKHGSRPWGGPPPPSAQALQSAPHARGSLVQTLLPGAVAPGSSKPPAIPSLAQFLREIGLARYEAALAGQGVTTPDLLCYSEVQLQQAGLRLGPRRTVQHYARTLRAYLESAGVDWTAQLRRPAVSRGSGSVSSDGGNGGSGAARQGPPVPLEAFRFRGAEAAISASAGGPSGPSATPEAGDYHHGYDGGGGVTGALEGSVAVEELDGGVGVDEAIGDDVVERDDSVGAIEDEAWGDVCGGEGVGAEAGMGDDGMGWEAVDEEAMGEMQWTQAPVIARFRQLTQLTPQASLPPGTPDPAGRRLSPNPADNEFADDCVIVRGPSAPAFPHGGRCHEAAPSAQATPPPTQPIPDGSPLHGSPQRRGSCEGSAGPSSVEASPARKRQHRDHRLAHCPPIKTPGSFPGPSTAATSLLGPAHQARASAGLDVAGPRAQSGGLPDAAQREATAMGHALAHPGQPTPTPQGVGEHVDRRDRRPAMATPGPVGRLWDLASHTPQSLRGHPVGAGYVMDLPLTPETPSPMRAGLELESGATKAVALGGARDSHVGGLVVAERAVTGGLGVRGEVAPAIGDGGLGQGLGRLQLEPASGDVGGGVSATPGCGKPGRGGDEVKGATVAAAGPRPVDDLAELEALLMDAAERSWSGGAVGSDRARGGGPTLAHHGAAPALMVHAAAVHDGVAGMGYVNAAPDAMGTGVEKQGVDKQGFGMVGEEEEEDLMLVAACGVDFGCRPLAMRSPETGEGDELGYSQGLSGVASAMPDNGRLAIDRGASIGAAAFSPGRTAPGPDAAGAASTGAAGRAACNVPTMPLPGAAQSRGPWEGVGCLRGQEATLQNVWSRPGLNTTLLSSQATRAAEDGPVRPGLLAWQGSAGDLGAVGDEGGVEGVTKDGAGEGGAMGLTKGGCGEGEGGATQGGTAGDVAGPGQGRDSQARCDEGPVSAPSSVSGLTEEQRQLVEAKRAAALALRQSRMSGARAVLGGAAVMGTIPSREGAEGFAQGPSMGRVEGCGVGVGRESVGPGGGKDVGLAPGVSQTAAADTPVALDVGGGLEASGAGGAEAAERAAEEGRLKAELEALDAELQPMLARVNAIYARRAAIEDRLASLGAAAPLPPVPVGWQGAVGVDAGSDAWGSPWGVREVRVCQAQGSDLDDLVPAGLGGDGVVVGSEEWGGA